MRNRLTSEIPLVSRDVEMGEILAKLKGPKPAAFVLPDGMPPHPATMQQRVSQMQAGRLRPGQTLRASVDPSNPAAIWLDLEDLP